MQDDAPHRIVVRPTVQTKTKISFGACGRVVSSACIIAALLLFSASRRSVGCSAFLLKAPKMLLRARSHSVSSARSRSHDLRLCPFSELGFANLPKGAPSALNMTISAFIGVYYPTSAVPVVLSGRGLLACVCMAA